MDIDINDCPLIRCPSLSFESHDICHIEGIRLLRLKKAVSDNKENIKPVWLFEFDTRELVLASLFYDCTLDFEFSYYAFKLRQFNDLLTQFLRIRNFL